MILWSTGEGRVAISAPLDELLHNCAVYSGEMCYTVYSHWTTVFGMVREAGSLESTGLVLWWPIASLLSHQRKRLL